VRVIPRDGALYRLSVLAAAACVGLLLAALLRAPAGDEARVFSAISATGIMACGIAVLMIERMVRDTRIQARDSRAVVRAVRDLSAVGDPDLVRGELCRVAADLCSADAAVLLELADGETLEVTGMRGPGRLGARIPLEAAELRRVLWSGEPALLDASDVDLLVALELSPDAAMLVPVVTDGRPVGAIAVGWPHPVRRITSRLVEAIDLLAAEAGRAIERADLLAEVRDHAADLESVVEVTRRLPRAADALAARTAVCEAVLEVCDGMLAVLLEPDGAGNLVSTAAAGAHAAPVRLSLSDASTSVNVFRTGDPAFVADLGGEPGVAASMVTAAGAVSALWQPVLTDGRTTGVLVVAWGQPLGRLSHRAAAIVGLFAAEAAVAIERADLMSRLEGLNRMLKVQVEALKVSDQLKSDFVSSVSHELRTPLASILGYLDVLLEGELGEFEGEAREFLEIVDSNARRLLSLINDLLTLSGLESGRMVLRLEPVDLRGLVEQCVRDQLQAAEGHRLALSLGVPPTAVEAHVDRERFAQVITNIVANAIKFTPAGGRVSVALGRMRGGVALSVSDTGIGIRPEDREHLFERFFRAPNATDRAIPGTGLGLAICKGIVDAHGGQLTVESQIDEGTTMTVLLPTTPTPPTDGGTDE